MTTPTRSSQTVAVIGAGITGLSAAHRLLAQGHKVRIFERSARAGGSIGTELTEGWLIEQGPNSLLDGDPCVSALIAELGLQNEVVIGNTSAKKRFLVRDGVVQAMPSSPPSLLTTRLFSWRMRLGIFTELLQRPRLRPADVSLGRLVADHFGQEAVDYGLNPFVGGVYAGDPEQLSAQYSFPSLWKAEREKGSIIRGQIAAAKEKKAKGFKRSKIVSFRRGLQVLTDSLVASFPEGVLQLNSTVTDLRAAGPGWQVVTEGGSQPPTDVFNHVLFALPAHTLASIRVNGDSVAGQLTEIVHPPVTSLFLGYERRQVAHPLDGFGVLIPAVEKRRELGVLFSSSLFPGRAPDGHVALTVMVGGMRQPEIAKLSASELLSAVEPDLRELLGVSGAPVFQRYNAWAQAIPQYNLGYGKYLECFSQLESCFPGLHFGGNARDGISVPNCISSGLKLAQVLEHNSL